MSSKHTRDELLYLAKLAEQCERYDGKYKTPSPSLLNDSFVQRWLSTHSSSPRLATRKCASKKETFCRLLLRM